MYRCSVQQARALPWKEYQQAIMAYEARQLAEKTNRDAKANTKFASKGGIN